MGLFFLTKLMLQLVFKRGKLIFLKLKLKVREWHTEKRGIPHKKYEY